LVLSLGSAELRPVGAFVYPVLMGFIIGYLAYDMVHYYVHHAEPKTRLGLTLRRCRNRGQPPAVVPDQHSTSSACAAGESLR
jgi:hypothetical protein